MEDLREANPEALLADGFEEAYIGHGCQHGSPIVAIYDAGKCVEILGQREGWSWEEAQEYFEFNVRCAYVGVGTPIFLDRPFDD